MANNVKASKFFNAQRRIMSGCDKDFKNPYNVSCKLGVSDYSYSLLDKAGNYPTLFTVHRGYVKRLNPKLLSQFDITPALRDGALKRAVRGCNEWVEGIGGVEAPKDVKEQAEKLTNACISGITKFDKTLK